MATSNQVTVIGLTGPFGSGCSTTAKFLKDWLRYTPILLSDVIRRIWSINNPRRRPARSNLQALGNEIRKGARNPGEVARLAIEELSNSKVAPKRIVFDGIRNVGEVAMLREEFGRNFYLFALECPASERFGRLHAIYGNDTDRFREDNESDRDQEDAYGQQVELCVDAADVIIRNDDTVTLTSLREKVEEYVRVATGETPRYARPDEILMNLAYSASHGSKCLKRQVGAVLVDADPLEMGYVVGQGFNENPHGTLPCVEEPQYGARSEHSTPGTCYRDIVRHDSYVALARQKRRCPSCGRVLKSPGHDQPPWRCGKCDKSLDTYFWPERAMTLCTAVHAEVAAVLAAGRRASGTTLYSTTFPCFQCTEKIIQAGVRAVVFTEPYPDVKAAERLEMAKVKVVRFEGVRSSRFDEIFSRARPYVTQQRNAMQKARGRRRNQARALTHAS